MLQLTFCRLSRPQRQHFRKGIPGFYSGRLGASFMKFWPSFPYKRRCESPHHYPVRSQVSGRKIDWLYGHPKSSHEPILTYGENTLEVTGLPLGSTPEYIQERLRRFFSKFGIVTLCRALNHPLDAYQCEGTAYVSFRSSESLTGASKAVLRFGSRKLGHRTLRLRALTNDIVTDGKELMDSFHRNVSEITRFTKATYFDISSSHHGRPVSSLRMDDKAESAIEQVFGSVYEFLKSVGSVFFVDEEDRLHAKRLIKVDEELEKFERGLMTAFNKNLSSNWREGKPDLPAYTQRRIDLWDKQDKLPFDLQILSRDFRQFRVHDEKFLISSRKKRERAHARGENRKAAIASRS